MRASSIVEINLISHHKCFIVIIHIFSTVTSGASSFLLVIVQRFKLSILEPWAPDQRLTAPQASAAMPYLVQAFTSYFT